MHPAAARLEWDGRGGHRRPGLNAFESGRSSGGGDRASCQFPSGPFAQREFGSWPQRAQSEVPRARGVVLRFECLGCSPER